MSLGRLSETLPGILGGGRGKGQGRGDYKKKEEKGVEWGRKRKIKAFLSGGETRKM